MARDIEIKTRTFFDIPPKNEPANEILFDRVVFMDQGFDLNSLSYISECVMVSDMWYQFHVIQKSGKRLDFDFKRKGDCLMAQRELSRAWTRTGEFKYEDVSAGESSLPE